MTTDSASSEKEIKKIEIKNQGSTGTVYGLGMIGACVYYISQAKTPKDRFQGFLKGLAWPAFLVYDALKFLHKE